MKKLYFRNEDSERCHEKEYFIDEMKDVGIKEMMVFVVQKDKSKDYFWCKAIDDVCANDDTHCGKECEDYKPCNGKSGKCRLKGYCYIPTNKVILTIK
jgi:Mn-containing catalase